MPHGGEHDPKPLTDVELAAQAEVGTVAEGDRPSFFTARDLNTGQFLLFNRQTGEREVISEAPPGALPAVDPSAPFGTKQEAARVMQQNRLGATHIIQWQPSENGWRIVPVPPAETVMGDVGVQNRIDTNGDGIDDLAVLTDGTLVDITKPGVAPGDVAIAGEPVRLADGTSIVTLNNGQSIRVGAPEGVAEVFIDPQTGKVGLRQPNGTVSFPSALNEQLATLEQVNIGGQVFAFSPQTGGFQAVFPRVESKVVTDAEGREFLRDTQGNLTPLAAEAVPDADSLINSRLLAGDVAGAIALDDFRNRPSSIEAFNAAMQFAQAPGDVAVISAIARGQTLVQPPPVGQVQRIAAQPQFLIDAWERLQRNIFGGAGSPADLMAVVEGFAEETAEARKQREQANADAQAAEDKLARDAEATKEAEGKAKDKVTQDAFADFQSRIDDLTGQVDALLKPTAKLPAAAAPAEKPTVPVELPAGAISINPTEFSRAVPGDEPLPAPALPVTAKSASAPQAGPAGLRAEQRFVDEEDDFFAHGGIFDDNTAIVAEDGPELIIAPVGTRVIPLKGLKKDKKSLDKLKKTFGIQGMQDGGTVGPLLPLGVRRAIAGGLLEPTRRRLSTAAGLPVLSAQAQQNISPDEFDVFARLSREAGISTAEFQRELQSAIPGANRFPGRARFAPRVLR